jgi:membrane protease YdiL (CAAX protease family)
MARRSLITLLVIAVVFVCLQLFLRPFFRGSPLLGQVLTLIYVWAPGIVALIFAKMEKVNFPVFARPNRFFYLIPVVTMGISLVAFLVSIPFGILENPNPAFAGGGIGRALSMGALFLVTSYLFVFVLFGLIFLGGELYWRGYLLEKWRMHGLYRGLWLIAFCWVLWQIPVMILSYSPGLPHLWENVAWTFVVNFILTPFLTYFRLKGKSVLTSAAMYGSLLASFLYFIVLFPIERTSLMAIYGGLNLLGIVGLSLLLKLYSPAKWQEIS